MKDTDLADILIKYREDRELTSEEMANLIGVSRPTYSKLENRKIDPSKKTVRKIAELLNYSPQQVRNLIK